jgi:hypothetical protein
MIGFRILQLPLDSWQEYKAIRLKALKTDPQAFLSPYSKESAYPDEKWQQRLEEANAGISSWVYFAQNEGKLVGMIGGYRPEKERHSESFDVYYH